MKEIKQDKQEILKRKCGLLNRWQLELRLLPHYIFQHKSALQFFTELISMLSIAIS